MAELLGDRVVPVTSIDQTGERVKVSVEGGDEYFGEAIILTIPFTVLKELDVRPGWSAGKQRMFDEMEWSNTVKIVVQKTPAWLSKGTHGWPMAGGDRPWERLIDITGNEPGGHGNAFFLPERQKRRSRHRPLSGEPGDEFAWTEQPWIGASFGGPPVGGGWMIEEWTRPEDHLHFAGDWTTMKSGWVEGAIESGLRAARKIDPAAPAEELTG
jgi:monoamine oxidase/UDP-galactopyranose mutase